MIIILNNSISSDEIINTYNLNNVGKMIVEKLSSSIENYEYSSIEELLFEIHLRDSIISASKDLNKSKIQFTTFRESKCNPKFWDRTDEGGFLLKPEVKPSDAISDIYKNGYLYGTECATAIVIIFYKGILDRLPKELFNEMFSDIYLMNWLHLDRDLGVRYYSNLTDYLPGDCRYFDNPDVSPLTPELQGLNVIDLGNGTYYGHDTGIKNADQIIRILNRHRKENPTESAFLVDSATRPNFKYLYKRYHDYKSNLDEDINLTA